MTAEDYIDAVRLLPCCVCGYAPVSAHHVVGGSAVAQLGARGNKKHSDWLVIPLCHRHHQGDDGLHEIGVLTWEEKYGDQVDLVTRTGRLLGVDPWREWQAEHDARRSRRVYRRLAKVMPRRNA